MVSLAVISSDPPHSPPNQLLRRALPTPLDPDLDVAYLSFSPRDLEVAWPDVRDFLFHVYALGVRVAVLVGQPAGLMLFPGLDVTRAHGIPLFTQIGHNPARGFTFLPTLAPSLPLYSTLTADLAFAYAMTLPGSFAALWPSRCGQEWCGEDVAAYDQWGRAACQTHRPPEPELGLFPLPRARGRTTGKGRVKSHA